MRNPRATKRQREHDRQERAERKKQRRADREEADAAAPVDETAVDQDQVLEQLAALHQNYAAGNIELEDFESARDELTSQLHVD